MIPRVPARGVCAETLGLNKLGEAGCWEREAECLWKGWRIVRPECWWLPLHHRRPMEIHEANGSFPAFTRVHPCLHCPVQTFTLFFFFVSLVTQHLWMTCREAVQWTVHTTTPNSSVQWDLWIQYREIRNLLDTPYGYAAQCLWWS